MPVRCNAARTDVPAPEYRVMVPMLHGLRIEAQALLYRLGLCSRGRKRLHKGSSRTSPGLTLFGRRVPSTVELATVDIVCADVMKLRPYQA